MRKRKILINWRIVPKVPKVALGVGSLVIFILALVFLFGGRGGGASTFPGSRQVFTSKGVSEFPRNEQSVSAPASTKEKKLTHDLITFVRKGNIWVMNPDGRNPKQLTFTGRASSPVFSPNRAAIAYLSVPKGSTSGAPRPHNIWVIQSDGTGVTKLTDKSIMRSRPAWSPDGTRLAFVEDGKLVVINVKGKQRLVLADNARFLGIGEPVPSWSPDGKMIACLLINGTSADLLTNGADADLWVIRIDNLSKKRVTFKNIGGGLPYAFSPTKNVIAYVYIGLNGNRSIWLVDEDGRNNHPLNAGIKKVGNFVWSPDGHWLAFAKDGATSTLWVASADGNKITKLFEYAEKGWTIDIAWSLDNQRIFHALSKPQARHNGISSIKIDGTDNRQLTQQDDIFLLRQ